MILSKHEIDELDTGYYSEVFTVKQHEVKRFNRAPQVVKNKTIYDFAHRFLNQLERHGVSGADQRHVKNLIELLRSHTR